MSNLMTVACWCMMIVSMGIAVEIQPSLFVCDAGEPTFRGEYSSGTDRADGAPIYSNDNDLSFFRNNGFW